MNFTGTDGSSGAAGSAIPLRSLRSQTHNANFLAAALLCRIYKHTGRRKISQSGALG